MIHLMVCAFGMVFSFMFGLVFSFNPWVSAASVGFIGFLAHLVTSYFKVPPPGNFFFVMLAAVAGSVPFDVELLPSRVGLVGMGAMLSVLLAFFYSVFIAKKVVPLPVRPSFRPKAYTKIVESIIIGAAMALSLAVGYVFKLHTPYWIAVSALAVLQGRDLIHTRQRNFHRIFGTFIGIGLIWIIFGLGIHGLALVVVITLLQFVIELLIVRNYGLAAIFILPLTILLAETAGGLDFDINTMMEARLADTIIGSLIGLVAGWLLHHRDIIARLERRIRSTGIFLRRWS